MSSSVLGPTLTLHCRSPPSCLPRVSPLAFLPSILFLSIRDSCGVLIHLFEFAKPHPQHVVSFVADLSFTDCASSASQLDSQTASCYPTNTRSSCNMYPALQRIHNSALFGRLLIEADAIRTIFVGLDTEYLLGLKVGDLGVDAFPKGHTDPLEVHHIIIRENLKEKPKALASCFTPSIVVSNHAELSTHLDRILKRFATDFERVVLVGCPSRSI